MEFILLIGLLFIIYGILIAFWGGWTEDDQQKKYVIKGLTLAFFAVFVFIGGSWLARVVFVNMLDNSYAALNGWIFAVPLMLMWFLGFSNRRDHGK